MSEISLIRTWIGDRKKAVSDEVITEQATNGRKTYQLDMFPLTSAPSACVILWKSGVTAATNSYVLSGYLGRVTFSVAPTAGAVLKADYTYYTLSSGDITEMLSGHTGSPMLVAANACLAIAADYARLGVYVQGNKTVNLDKVAKKLLDLSKDLENKHYTQSSYLNYKSSVFTFKDDTGTPYDSFDTAVAFIDGTGV